MLSRSVWDSDGFPGRQGGYSLQSQPKMLREERQEWKAATRAWSTFPEAFARVGVVGDSRACPKSLPTLGSSQSETVTEPRDILIPTMKGS